MAAMKIMPSIRPRAPSSDSSGTAAAQAIMMGTSSRISWGATASGVMVAQAPRMKRTL
jgi:hypothetical protein